MTLPPEPETKSIFKNPFLYSSFALAIVALVVGWIVLSRWQENKQIDRQTAGGKRENKKRTTAPRSINSAARHSTSKASTPVPVPSIPAKPSSYATEWPMQNRKARAATQPRLALILPLRRRHPTKTTTYSLTIQDAAGNTKTQSVEVKVEGK